ncbi:trans-aconitate 2-methyltransferase [Pseudorhodoferax sp. Leaf267]|uniref:trans-aconitate 2-methyltransferase n=1 Tax=Pseudorhodoferax sp. Leaf267 TaxID=1736316 RepID=UPI0006FE3E88|nr:trans-aconitate 2-methyltransferase [Pseudorhodoferax sp. Leaf267]KQP14347.1 trans-aconitate methyltransferase [Pseudorhodoferax sp. Leaf267]
MLDWNPALYRRYEDERTRPAQDLLARVPLAQAAHVVDLGCGPGNSTELLVQRFPGAAVTGVDNSEPMLASARERLPQARFAWGDIATWAPREADGPAPDLIYANAALQWVPGHETLVPRLFSALAPGGVLAIQMPDNRQEPTHRLMREVAAQAPWAEPIGDADKLRTELLGINGYYDLLAPVAAQVDVWHTIYQHPMASAAAIVEWVRSTGLKPYVDRLPPKLQASYLAEYERRVAAAYAPRADGKRLLAFPRLFIVARKTA